MPRVVLLTASSPERAGVVPAECQAPLADGFVGDRNAPLESLAGLALTLNEISSENDRIETHLC